MTDTDLLRGANEIGAFFRRTPKATYHLLQAGKLPGAFLLGGVWYARKSTLTKMIEALERGEQPEPAPAPPASPPPPAPPATKRKPGRPRKNPLPAGQTVLSAG